LVTILICTYNRAHLISEALKSARDQTWPREIIVVNDGSSDGTREVLSAVDGVDGIRVIHQENGGKPTALNAGLAMARGEAVLVLDDDDRLMPGALHILATALFNNPLAGCVIGDTLVFEDKTNNPLLYKPSTRVGPGTAEHMILQNVPGMPGASLVRMSTQRVSGPYSSDLIRGQDMDMFLRLSRGGDIQGVPIPTFWYRSHDELRGSAAGQWRKSDWSHHEDRFMDCVSPVFEKRYREMGVIKDRGLGHSWAIGLHLRRLDALAIEELNRWPAPHTQREAWIREQLGLASTLREATESLLVIDDGNPGALEDTLYRHAKDRSIWVNLQVPRDPLGRVRLFWPGNYGARQNNSQWFQGPGAIHIRLSSDPFWTPPPIDSARWIPNLPGINGVLALAAAMDWPAPSEPRRGLAKTQHPHVDDCRQARMFLQERRPVEALRIILTLVRAMPMWPGGWKLASEGFLMQGKEEQAHMWLERIQRIRSAS